MASDWRALRYLADIALERSNYHLNDEKPPHRHSNDSSFPPRNPAQLGNSEDRPLPSPVWPSEPTLYRRRFQLEAPSERFYNEMLFFRPRLHNILTVEPWEPLIQDALSHSPETVFQNAEYRIEATDVTLFRPLTRGDIVKIGDGGHKHIVLYTQKMDDMFAYIRIASYTPSLHLDSRPILVVRREMCDAPFPHELRHEALAAIKNDPPFAFLDIRAWAMAKPDL